MSVIAKGKNNTENGERLGMNMAAMGLVNRKGDRFIVLNPLLSGERTSSEVRRDENGKICCNCAEFDQTPIEEIGFRCEHIGAVKFALALKNCEPVARQKALQTTESESVKSTCSEQKENETLVEVSANGQVEIVNPEARSLTEIQKEIRMNMQNSTDPAFTAAGTAEIAETKSNVVQMNFAGAPHSLQQNIDVEFGKKRNRWNFGDGYVPTIDYVESHTFTEILDAEFNANPMATSLMDLVAAKQLGMIRAISRQTGIDADEECQTILGCKTHELSKIAATAFIQHLQDVQILIETARNQPLRKVG